MRYAKVLFSDIKGEYTYQIPENFSLKKGDIILVPLRDRKKFGIVWKISNKKDYEGKIKKIENKTDFFLPENIMELAGKVADYYFTHISKILKFFLPPLGEVKRRYFLKHKEYQTENEKEQKVIEILKNAKNPLLSRTVRQKTGFSSDYYIKKLLKKDIIGITHYLLKKPSLKKFIIEPFEKIEIPERFTPEQEKIYREILEKISEFKVHLIHGVTGSGKTFLYLKLVEKVLEKGKSVILLIPEISLVPQIYFIFKKYFKEDCIILWGSALSRAERLYSFKSVLSGKPCIVMGPRSAVFAPLKNTGIIVIDEEQENSYKEDERFPYYHAKEIAKIRAEIENIPLILGTATPQSETYYFAKKSEYKLYPIKERVRGYYFPKVEILDMREERFPFFLSAKIIEEIERTVKNRKQVILFLNRRGFAHFMQCMDCGYIFECKNCSIPYVYHKKRRKLVCHFCGDELKSPDFCPLCGGTDVKYSGYGTEKIEEGLKDIFPDFRIIRMDLDTTRQRKRVFEIFRRLKNREADVLLGTQMIIKGFDFPEVSLIGILYADLTLNLPDFRARERTFIMLNQVIGRARKGGKVIIQTMNPENPVIRHIKEGNMDKFYEEELKEREMLSYPPFSHLMLVETRNRKRKKAMEQGEEIREIVDEDLEILGPSFAPIEKIRNLYRVRLLIKSKKREKLGRVFENISKLDKKYPFRVEINPYNFL